MNVHGLRWLNLAQVSRETGLSRKMAVKELRRIAWVYPPRGDPAQYDARSLDLLRAMHGQSHRTLEPAHQDWLTDYLKGPR